MAEISKVINAFSGATEEEVRNKERLSFIQKMAQSKSDLYECKLKDMFATGVKCGLEIVETEPKEYHSGQHVNISDNCDEALSKLVDKYFQGKDTVKRGFCSLVKSGFSKLISDTTIGETEDKKCFVYPENNSLIRVDVMAYKYTFSASGVIAKDIDNIFVYTMSKSVVDHTRVSADCLLHEVVEMMRTDEDKDPDLNTVMDYIRELISCWRFLDSVHCT